MTVMKMATITLRAVQVEDCRLLWQWANDPHVRKAAFNTAPIGWESHQEWFAGKLEDPSCYMLIAEDENGGPVGQARFDMSWQSAEIHVSVCPAMRGKGYGSAMIQMAVNDLLSRTSIQQVHAFIKPENSKSIAAFERASFQRVGLETVRGNAALHYIRNRNL